MDDSDLALEQAVQRLDSESSGEEAASSRLKPVSENCSVVDESDGGGYTSADQSSFILYQRMALIRDQRRKVNSLQHSMSGSEDNSSMASFATDSDAGAKSAVFGQTRSKHPPRMAVSDTEGTSKSRRKARNRHPQAYLTEDKPVTHEEFAQRVYERLSAVAKDREHMTIRARDLRRQQGNTFEEIMSAQWYDLPEARKYLDSEPTQTNAPSTLHPPTNHHMLSPLEIHSPGSSRTPGTGDMDHLNGMGMMEVEDALREWNLSSSQQSQIQQQQHHQHHRKLRHHSQRQVSGASSVISGASDSGVGDTYQSSNLATPTNNCRVHDYLQQQNNITARLPERDRTATAAAIALMSNSPQPENLNPLPGPAHRYHDNDRHRRGHGGHRTGHYTTSDDSSSVFTITSNSTTSDLFIPRRAQNLPMYNADSDDPQHYTAGRPRRMLSTPKRSSHIKQSSHAPSPLAGQSAHQPPRPASHQARGDTLIMYTLDDLKTPFAKRLPGTEITLKDFKERVFARKGEYRFFFKYFCPDVNMELLEEYSDELAPLPLVEGKIVGRVEKITE